MSRQTIEKILESRGGGVKRFPPLRTCVLDEVVYLLGRTFFPIPTPV
jgi:hypothetical protein